MKPTAKNNGVKSDVLSSKNYNFGEIKVYKKNDVVVWRGQEPCIGKIKQQQKGVESCWVICDSHNSLHFSNLRPATKEEKLKLGRKRIIFIVANIYLYEHPT